MLHDHDIQAAIKAHASFHSDRARLGRAVAARDRAKAQRVYAQALAAVNGHVPPHCEGANGQPLAVDAFMACTAGRE